MKEKISFISAMMRFFLILILFIAVIINSIYISIVVDTLIILIYSIFLYKRTRFLFFYSFFIFTFLRLVISLYILEYFKVFLFYSEQITFYKGSLDEFLLILVIIVEISYFLYQKIEFPELNSNLLRYFEKKLYYIILIITSGSTLHVFLIRHQLGYVHRVEFAKRFLENSLYNHFLQIIIMGGMVIAGIILKKSKIKGFLLLFILCLYAYLIGEKFGYFFYILCFMLLGISINTSVKQCRSYLKYVGCFLVGMIFCCIAVMSTMYKIPITKAVVFFEQRVCQDNESWWYFYDKDYNDLNIFNEMKSFKYKGIGDLYDIGYENARLFGSHMLAEKIKGYNFVKEEYDRKKRIASGSITQLKIYGREYYFLIAIYIYTYYFIVKEIVDLHKKKYNGVLMNFLVFIYLSFLLRFLIQTLAGIVQVNNEFFNIKTIYFLLIIIFYKLLFFSERIIKHTIKTVKKEDVFSINT
ncbi:hypothetical protein [Fusobacterium polymorphum]|uniref:hypothetical protein n=1 Tax=Fusobacterium nucleatum subsp. polymorphum TaxID=76857 RepID=UPI00300BDB0A